MQSNKGFVYLPSVLKKDQRSKKKYNFRFKKIRQCQKERFSHRKEREEINMVSEREWLLLTGERCYLVEEQKEEKNYLCQLKLDIKNND